MSIGTGYEKADSRNLPSIMEDTVINFFTSNPNFVTSESRQVKMQRSGRKNYGDMAVGFVKLQRFGEKCRIIASVVPEHRVNQRSYEVSLVINEANELIEDFSCECEANMGGCKHVSVFIFWIFRRNETPASTEVECYWNAAPMTAAARKKGVLWANEIVFSKNTPSTLDNDQENEDGTDRVLKKQIDPLKNLDITTDNRYLS
ncbi:uncharacterized protein LOC134205428 [Armigeres subalbatus]|uniref:uncharacterized protein LOC134205428 n=1 Tax=Armigeres subalbatus TaxID=124917 RepID=UPI002ED38067